MIVEGYNRFGGAHWETGSIRNVLAHQGIGPGMGQPLSEAMLFGIAGGVAVLYFAFEYEGYEPHVFVGTRYGAPGYDLLDTLCRRLSLKAKVRETTGQAKAVTLLTDSLAGGQPAIVWASLSDLPYNAMEDTGFAGAMPIVVYGYDEAASLVHISDRSHEPLTCTTGELAKARAAQVTLKNKVLTLAAPEPVQDLRSAIEEGLRSCVKLMLDGPAKGPKANFGLAALQKWAALMTDTRDKKSWPNVFAPGRNMYSGLVWTFTCIELFGTGGSAARPMYADFLEEASVVLDKPHLKEVALKYRASGERWTELANALLPGSVPPFKETRELLLRKNRLFIERGMDALEETQQISEQLQSIKGQMATDFPLDTNDAARLREEIREHVLRVHDAENEAALSLREAIDVGA